MEARLVDDLPAQPGWQFEPKWDGFRCLAFRAGDQVEMRAKSGKPLARYFPEVVALLRELRLSRFVLDGELAIPAGETLSFDALQMRLHPAETRIRRLAIETPAVLMLFPASPAMRPEDPGGGAPTVRPNGCRCARNWSSKFVTIMSLATASAMARDFCAGGPTSRPDNAPLSSSIHLRALHPGQRARAAVLPDRDV